MACTDDQESRGDLTVLRALFFEDCREDIELCLRTLRSSGFKVTADMAVTAEGFLASLRSTSYDVILADYRMPNATGMEMFEQMRAEGVETPFILVTGALGEEKAVECLKDGVADYVLKDRLVRLPAAVRRAIAEQRLRKDRALAEDALRRSEASYRSLISSAPCGILRLHARDGHMMEANPSLAAMLGYDSPDELLKHSAANGFAVGRDALAGFEASEAYDVVETNVEWSRKDHTPVRLRFMGRLLRDESGTPDCLEMIAENTTERDAAQARIRQLNRLYSVLSHEGQAIVRIRERDGLLQETCRILTEEGLFQMAWAGVADSETGQVIPVATCPVGAGYVSRLTVTVRNEPAGCGPVGTAIRENRHVVCNDLEVDSGMSPWLELAHQYGYRSVGAFPLVVQDRAIGALAIYASQLTFFDEEIVVLLDELAANVSFALERMEADQMRHCAIEELDQFFAVSREMLCIADGNGYMRRVNAAWEKALGFGLDDVQGKTWVDFVHPEDQPQAMAAFLDLKCGTEIESLELRFLSKSGAYKWLAGSATPVLERGVVFAALRDITERKDLEEQLRRNNVALEQQNRRANEASRMKSEFLANMSHELRSPLNGIIGFSELLYDGKLGPLADRPREFIGRIHASATHLLQLINGVLDLSKVEAGRMEFRPEPVIVSEVIREVIGILGALASGKQIRIRTEIELHPDQVFTDPGRLKQILYNYLSNALKFTGEGGQVIVRLKEEGAARFRLEVSDTGAGIQEKDLSRLFVEFQQLDATTSKRHQGTGLGLSLTKRLVEAQGGRVGVESEFGRGSTFFAVLPCEPVRESGRGPRILVIEDDRVGRFLITRILEGTGCHVENAGTSAEAIEKCRRQNFDAITLDLLLPDGPGWEAVRTIRSFHNHRETPVIAISMLEKSDVEIEDQIQAFLSKPVEARTLLETLKHVGVTLPPVISSVTGESCGESIKP